MKSITLALAISLLAAAVAAADPSDGESRGGNDYDLTWHTIDCGGGVSVGGSYELSGTMGQPDAGSMTGESYTIAGGFWTGAGDAEPQCPVVADIDCNGVVSVSDLLALLNAWGTCTAPCPADLNEDGVVNVSDMLLLLQNWG